MTTTQHRSTFKILKTLEGIIAQLNFERPCKVQSTSLRQLKKIIDFKVLFIGSISQERIIISHVEVKRKQ